ncbi:peptidoglycan-binding domain-containing protein [Sulfurovum sp. ST-21]|uniref:Peptidoglycan-binding protein n=1 Tax=Sulfurovum indicum TaxID=2779528 RepID=A0A7M1S1W3_9BACT|nr:peptidoglycan-binding protein [Sulfurovum indicum]QOR61435.1 peptidoglycan-binding protein [Sulfurovum indicum]
MHTNYLKVVLLGSLISGHTLYADFADGVVGGLVGGAVGSVITNEIYNSNKASEPAYRPVQKTASHRTHKRASVPKMTDGMKLQKALAGLGFYRGRIDGEVNSFETRTAIKELNNAYHIGNTASLKPEEKDTLIYLGTLFMFDRYLIAQGNDKITRGKRIQTALKVLGFYYGKIDGIVGSGTRRAISEYQQAYGLGYGSGLDFEAEYRLISNAKAKNEKNINDSIAALKAMGQPPAKPQNDMQKQTPEIIKLQTQPAQQY